VAIAIAGLLVWLFLFRSDATPVAVPGEGPVATTAADLAQMSERLRQPIYWAGPVDGGELELTVTGTRRTFVRYLTNGAEVGDPSPEFLTVGTYPALDGYRDLRAFARANDARTRRIAGGALAVIVPDAPTSVFLAYPDQDLQLEVYDPHPGRALELVTSGAVRAVQPGVQPAQGGDATLLGDE
jgi:hypothetical protein